MNYELAKKLKDAGFQYQHFRKVDEDNDVEEGWTAGRMVCINKVIWILPNLSELIEACGDNFRNLNQDTKPKWQANAYKNENGGDNFAYGLTPEEAVANLWLLLNS